MKVKNRVISISNSYKTIHQEKQFTISELTEKSNQGWKLICFHEKDNLYLYVFKKHVEF